MSLKLEIDYAVRITDLERKVNLLETKYQQEISRLEIRIKDLEYTKEPGGLPCNQAELRASLTRARTED